MLGDAYTLDYLSLFDEELAEAVRYITCELRNPDEPIAICVSRSDLRKNAHPVH